MREIEARLPHGCGRLRAPLRPVPRGLSGNARQRPGCDLCDQVRAAARLPALRGLRWSYGAVKGRPADWPAALAGQPLPYVLAAAGAAGFSGLWVDPAGFEPAAASACTPRCGRLLGEPGLLSPDGDLWFFDLRPYLARLARAHTGAEAALLRHRSLYPLRSVCRRGALELLNPGASAVAATLLRPPRATRRRSTKCRPDASPTAASANRREARPVTVLERLTLAPGRMVIGDPRAPGGATQVALLLADRRAARLLRRRPGRARARSFRASPGHHAHDERP